MRRLVPTAALLASSMLMFACLDDSEVQHGILDWGDGVNVQVPARAAPGQTFMGIAATWGGCITAERVDVTYVNEDIAIVEPFDRSRPDCKLAKLCGASHRAQLSFDTPGNKIILFRGRSRMLIGDPPMWQERFQLVDVQTTVLVE